MKRKNKERLLLLLALMLGTAAQTLAQDAFYIYRNDGGFEGFFYDEVQSISYSKIDTLGVEQEDYVVEEILTRDSLYRIPLTAIDSVSFVQPEIIYNPELRQMDELGLTDYIETAEGLTLTFAANMPAELRPVKNNVLASTDVTKLTNGFAGRVVSTSTDGSGRFVVVCDSLNDFSDLFIQYITVEEYGRRGSSPHYVHLRTAGEERKSPRRVNYDITLFDFSLSPHLPWSWGDQTVSIDLNTSLSSTLKAVFNFSVFGKKYMKADFGFNAGVKLGFTYDIKLKDLVDLPIGPTAVIPPIFLPGSVPLLELDIKPEGFIRSEVHATGNITTPMFDIDLRAGFEWDMSKNWLPGGFYFRQANEKEGDEGIDENKWTFNGSLNGFLQAGCKFPLGVKTASWLKRFLSSRIGFNFYVGPKISGELDFNLRDMLMEGMGKGTKLYNAVKDSKINLSPLTVDYEAKAYYQIETSDAIYESDSTNTFTFLDGSLGVRGFDWHFLPEFEKPELSLNTKNPYEYAVDVRVRPKDDRNILLDVGIGAALYTLEDSLVAIAYDPHDYSFWTKYWDENPVATISLKQIPSGEYYLYPMVKNWGVNIAADPREKVVVDRQASFDISKALLNRIEFTGLKDAATGKEFDISYHQKVDSDADKKITMKNLSCKLDKMDVVLHAEVEHKNYVDGWGDLAGDVEQTLDLTLTKQCDTLLWGAVFELYVIKSGHLDVKMRKTDGSPKWECSLDFVDNFGRLLPTIKDPKDDKNDDKEGEDNAIDQSSFYRDVQVYYYPPSEYQTRSKPFKETFKSMSVKAWVPMYDSETQTWVPKEVSTNKVEVDKDGNDEDWEVDLYLYGK